MRSRGREGDREQGKQNQRGLHPTMDGDRDGEPHWSCGLSHQGTDEEQKEGEHEQGSQDCEGCIHPLSSPRPAGLGLNEHVIKPDSLNVVDMGAD